MAANANLPTSSHGSWSGVQSHAGAGSPKAGSMGGMMHGNLSKRRRNHAVYSHKTDALIGWIKSVLMPTFDLGTMDAQIPELLSHIEGLIEEHVQDPEQSRLKTIVPDVPKFFAPVRLREAFRIYNSKYRITSRRFVYPTFNEIRHVINLGQVLGLEDLRLITFDGDQTLYPDQKNFEDMGLARQLMVLLKAGVKIALVTAANYYLQCAKYETRLQGLLDFFKEQQLEEEYLSNFYIVAGESNFLLKIGADYRIHPDQERWPKKLPVTENMLLALDSVENALRTAVQDLNMKAQVLRKKTSVGVIVAAGASAGKATYYFRREQLDEMVFRIQDVLIGIKDKIDFPYCAFNGGNDVWFDVGNKKEGIEGLQMLFDVKSGHSLHVGDQMASTGNDFMARYQAPVSWIVNPQETKKILQHVIRSLGIGRTRVLAAENSAESVSGEEGIDAELAANAGREESRSCSATSGESVSGEEASDAEPEILSAKVGLSLKRKFADITPETSSVWQLPSGCLTPALA